MLDLPSSYGFVLLLLAMVCICVCVCVNWSMVAHTCVLWLGRQRWLGIPHKKRPLLYIGEGAWPYCSQQSA